jgi:hypothetical protein
MSTFATLLVLPSIFAVVIGRSVARSPSIYPDDPDSAHFDPLAYAHMDEKVSLDAVEEAPSFPQPGELSRPFHEAQVVHVGQVTSKS